MDFTPIKMLLCSDRSLSWLGTGTSIKSGRVKLVLWPQTSSLGEMILPCMSKMPTPTYYQTNSVIIKYAIFLNIILYIFNIRDTEAVIGIIFVLLKIFDGLNQPTFYPNPIDNAICTQLTEYVSTSRA